MSLSYSALAAYRTCPKQYEYAFVRKLSQPMTKETAFGVSVHSALSKWGKLEVEKRETSDVRLQSSFLGEEQFSQVSSLKSQVLLQLWHESFITSGYATTFEADYDRKRGEDLMMAFYAWWGGGKRNVVGVEKGFKIAVNERKEEREKRKTEKEMKIQRYKDTKKATIISGRFDRIEQLSDETLRIIDYKTGATRTQDAVDQDLQMSVYALAAEETFGKPVAEIILLFLNEDGLTERRTMRDAGELAIASKSIVLISERIDQKDFAPMPSVAVCARCPFRRVCPVSMAKSS